MRAAACSAGEPVFVDLEEVEVSKKPMAKNHSCKNDTERNSQKVGWSNEYQVNDWID